MPCLLTSRHNFSNVAIADAIKQRLGVLEIDAIEAFREPGIDRRQRIVRPCVLARCEKQAGETRGGAQLQELGILPPRRGQRINEASLCRVGIASRN
jgi:hypothetical protein